MAAKKKPNDELQMADVLHRTQARDAYAKVGAIIEKASGKNLAFAADALRMLANLPIRTDNGRRN